MKKSLFLLVILLYVINSCGSYNIHLRKGKKELETYKYDNAINLFKEGLIENPQDYELNLYLGYAFFDNSNYIDSIKQGQICLELESNDKRAYILLGESYFYNKKFNLSIKYYKKALKYNGEIILNNIAFAYYCNNEINNAENYYQFCVSNNESKLLRNYSQAMLSLIQNDKEEANKYFNKTINIINYLIDKQDNDLTYDLFLIKAVCLVNLNDFQSANESIEEAYKIGFKHYESINWIPFLKEIKDNNKIKSKNVKASDEKEKKDGMEKLENPRMKAKAIAEKEAREKMEEAKKRAKEKMEEAMGY